MTDFPLYELIKNETLSVKDKLLSVEQKNDLMEKVKLLDIDAKTSFYVLVRCFEYETEQKTYFFNKTEVPYKGTYDGAKVEFNFLNFPNHLQQILYNFVLKYSNKIAQESCEEM